MRLTFLVPLAVVGAAEAQESPAAPPLKAIECFCTDRMGFRVELGETICLMVDGRAYMARCEMSLNVPAWRDTGSDCVGAMMSTAGAMSLPVPAGGA